jgi:hypothetical protein
MKYPVYIIMFALFFTGKIFSEQKVVKPVNNKSKTVVIVSGEERDFYMLHPEKVTILNVRGPGKLKMFSRGTFTSEDQQTLDYSFKYRINGGTFVESKFRNIKRSKTSVYKDKKTGIPGTEEVTEVRLRDGENTIEIWGGNKKIKVAARYLFTPSKQRKIKWVTLTPLDPNEPVNLVADEEVINYFRFSEKKPLKIVINGPTQLRVLTRVENHADMKGRIVYRLQVKEDGTIKNTYQLNSLRSESAFYQKDPGNVPGRAKEIVISVPRGTHTYEIIPMDKDKGTILGKVLFPKKDIKL